MNVKDHYDVVVVGSGLGGLTAASLLATAGRQVLLVERHDRFGGYAHSFQRHRYHFDSAVHLIGGCSSNEGDDGGIIHQVLGVVGARRSCEFVGVDPFYRAYYPGFSIDVPIGLEAFVDAHSEYFPSESDGIALLMRLCAKIRVETDRTSSTIAASRSRNVARDFPALARYHRATLAEVLDDYITDSRLKSVLSTCWPYAGLPPSRVSFLYWASMLISYISDGAYYCRGTFHTLADALADAVVRHGGDVMLSTGVRTIRIEAGRTVGVLLDDGRTIAAPVVVSNADARQTIERLVGEDKFPARYARAHRRRRPSVSAFVVYAATDIPLERYDMAHETFAFDRWDHDASFRSGERGTPNWLSVTVPTLIDDSLAPAGEHLVTLTTLVPHDASANWAGTKADLTDRMLARAEALVPELSGLSEHLAFFESASPFTMERYTGNSAGAIYGWDLSPGQVGAGRPSNRTPIEGLYLAGHWAQPGGGVYGVMTSGVEAAAAVLGMDRRSLFDQLVS